MKGSLCMARGQEDLQRPEATRFILYLDQRKGLDQAATIVDQESPRVRSSKINGEATQAISFE
jgi:hypothetical protein